MIEMIVKLSGITLITGSSTAIGFLLSGRLKERIEELKTIKKLLVLLRGEIRYNHATLTESFQIIAGRMDSIYEMFLLRVSEDLKAMDGQTLAQIWEHNVRDCFRESAMSREDKDRLISLGSQLGYLDIEMQLNTIELYLEQLQEEISSAQETLKRNGKLYQTMGVIAGIFVVLLIV